MKNNFIIAIICFTFSICAFYQNVQAFQDVENNEFQNYIEYLSEEKIISSENENFYPHQKITRFEFSKMVVEAADIKSSHNCDYNFSDVPNDSFFYDYVNTLVCNGIIEQKFSFRGAKYISRNEATKMIVKSFGIVRKNVPKTFFSDVEEDNEFEKYITIIRSQDIINGYEDNTFRGQNAILRQEASKIIAIVHGYTVFDKADHIRLEASTNQAPIGSTITITAYIEDEDNNIVEDYSHGVTFDIEGSNFDGQKVSSAGGIAIFTISSHSAKIITINTKARGLNIEKTNISFTQEEFQIYLHSSEDNLNPNQKTTLFITVIGKNGAPLSAKTGNITYRNSGSGMLSNLREAAQLEGVYTIDFQAGPIIEKDIIEITYEDDDIRMSTDIINFLDRNIHFE